MSTRLIAKKLSESFITTEREQKLPVLSETDGNKSNNGDDISTPAGTINDLSTFEAASADIRTVISSKGSICAAGIANIINRSNNVVALTRHHFPNAIGSSDVISKVKTTLDAFGANAENTLLTHSVCPDEINHEDGHINDLFTKKLGGGKVFHLGGLGGIPFTGKTGFAAFSHHVPDGGHAFILQAAHIGISNSLKLGQFTRDGQTHDGSACGAAVGALGHCAAGKPIPDLSDCGWDYQMSYIVNKISKSMERIDATYVESGKDENARQAMLARETHGIGKEMLDNIVSTDFGCDKSMLIVLTGIQLNMPFDFEDYFEPISFEVRKSDGTVIDVFERTFGKKKATAYDSTTRSQ
mmetsp:Transcript_26176/g.56695  ORF Transcript_26176/g.56695 Transcript_26176/m.56695 type:complete len:355 (-) Transcript_26176:29-1093(-)|eukprot:CAMPEP_0178659484 /NCGR_PEP_ID=MMETSP0698-20121128/26585_1 /TAXON_ID=265572 /ORGANISM="Extubocellulus spinifer, Strain CCMP396" /LENGTH=354 /DNA_ID=CAMNT_0020302015 /DNA_START=112 /DNA_END=1173 /DNA_ORIENTATION=-